MLCVRDKGGSLSPGRRREAYRSLTSTCCPHSQLHRSHTVASGFDFESRQDSQVADRSRGGWDETIREA